MNRKKFLQTSIRLGIAAGLITVGGYSVIKSLKNEDCSENDDCNVCGKKSNCQLSKAEKARMNGKQKEISKA